MQRRWSVPIISGLSALLAVVLVGPGLGPASGAIPNNGVYSACLTKSTGAVEIINAPKVKCAKGQRLIKWSQQGPAGPAGATGAQGPAGAQGATGAQGAQGPDGPADWNAIPNIPAGFADGVDNEGVTAVKVIYKEGTSVTVPPGEVRQTSTTCPAGSIAVAGGFSQGGNSIRVTQSNLYPTAVGIWYVRGFNTGTQALGLVPYVTCLEVTPSGALTIAKKGVKVGEAKKRGK